MFSDISWFGCGGINRQVVLRLLSDLHMQAEEGISAHACTHVLIKQDLKTGEKGNGDGRREKGGRGWRETGRRRGYKPSSCVIKIFF